MLCSQVESLPPLAWPDRGMSSLSVLHGGGSRVWDNSALYRILEDFKAQRRNGPPTLFDGTAEPTMPADPTDWSREDVASWIQYVSTTHHLPAVHLDRFLMNGKALCLMSMDMFVARVPLGGKLLYKDFQLRLSRALYS